MDVLFKGRRLEEIYSSGRERGKSRTKVLSRATTGKEKEKKSEAMALSRARDWRSLILARKIDRFDALYDSLNRLRYLQENLIIRGPAISSPVVNPSLSF